MCLCRAVRGVRRSTRMTHRQAIRGVRRSTRMTHIPRKVRRSRRLVCNIFVVIRMAVRGVRRSTRMTHIPHKVVRIPIRGVRRTTRMTMVNLAAFDPANDPVADLQRL